MSDSATMSDPAIRRGYVDNIYGQLHYRIAKPDGAPKYPPLLCLHQTPQAGWEWEPLITRLARDRVVLAPDTPGYGSSDAPPEPVYIEDFARCMIRFMDDMQAQGEIGAGPFDVIGYHTGSITATQLARAYPDRVRRIVPIGLACYDAPARAAKLANIGVFPVPKANDLSHVTQLWDLTGTMVDPRASPEWRHQQLAQSLTTGKRLPWGFIAVYRFDFMAAMAQVQQPVLIINLEDDLRAVTSANAWRYANGTEVKIDAASHGILTLEPDRMAKIVGDFLNAA
jgi:pimeloyl-ACP methyl ester carboxylesterase